MEPFDHSPGVHIAVPLWRCWYRNDEGTWTYDDVHAASAEDACAWLRPRGARTARADKASRIDTQFNEKRSD